jgi:transcriptional regulator with XRE-family HTH domain
VPSTRRTSSEIAFGRELRNLRLKRKISQEELGARSGYHRTYIGQLERGEKSPSLRTLFDLAATLDVLPSILVRTIEKAIGYSIR